MTLSSPQVLLAKLEKPEQACSGQGAMRAKGAPLEDRASEH